MNKINLPKALEKLYFFLKVQLSLCYTRLNFIQPVMYIIFIPKNITVNRDQSRARTRAVPPAHIKTSVRKSTNQLHLPK